MRRALCVFVSACALLGVLVAAPWAHAAITEGALAWDPAPYAPGTQSRTAFLALTQGPGDSVYVAGSYNGFLNSRGILARLDGGSGEKLWERTTKGPWGDGVAWWSAVADREHNVVVAGQAGMLRLLVAKYAPGGALRWMRALPRDSFAGDLAIGPRDTVYAAGTVYRKGTRGDGVVAKYGPGGSLLWKAYLGMKANDDIASIALDRRGAVYALGSRGSRTERRLVVARFSASGKRVWRRTLCPPGVVSDPVKLALGSDGVVVVGTRFVGDEVYPVLAKYSRAGALLWQRVDATRVSELADAVLLGDGRVAAVGHVWDGMTAARQLGVVLAWGPDGTPLASGRYFRDMGADGAGAAAFTSLAADAAGRLYVAGQMSATPGDLTESSAIVLRYSGPLEGDVTPDLRWRYRGAQNVYYWSPNVFSCLLLAGDDAVFAAGSQSAQPEGMTKGLVQKLVIPPSPIPEVVP